MTKCWTGSPEPPCKNLDMDQIFGNPLTGIVGQGCGAALRYPTRTQFCENPIDAPAGLTPRARACCLTKFGNLMRETLDGLQPPPCGLNENNQPPATLARRAAGTPLQISPPFAYSRWWLARVLSEAIFLVGGHGFSPYSGAVNSDV